MSIMTIEQFKQFLTHAGIDYSTWGVGATKTVEDLYMEFTQGETIFECSMAGLIRVVSVAVVTVNVGNLVLKETKQVFANGSTRSRDMPGSVSEKFKLGEDPYEAGFRGLQEELGIPIEGFIFNGELRINSSDPRLSRSYPGLMSRYRNYDFIVIMKSDFFQESGYMEDDGKKRTFFEWRHSMIS
jgi:hypothetical protein